MTSTRTSMSEGMRLDLAELAVVCFKDVCYNINGIFSIADQRAFVTVDVADVEEAAPSGYGSEHEKLGEIIEPDGFVEDDDEDWELEAFMTAEELEGGGMQDKMYAM